MAEEEKEGKVKLIYTSPRDLEWRLEAVKKAERAKGGRIRSERHQTRKLDP